MAKEKETNAPKEKPGDAKGKAGKNAKGKAPEKQEVVEEKAFLSNLRPRRRPIFLAVFLAGCTLIVCFHSGCDIPQKKRSDCGFSGVTSTECQTVACLKKGGGAATTKKSIKVSRGAGETLGLEVSKDTVVGWVTVTGISAGAVERHNGELAADSEDRIRLGDRISKADGVSTIGAKKADAAHEKMVKALANKGAKTVPLEIQRPRIPSYLMWVRSPSGNPNFAEKMLTAPGSKQLVRTFSTVGSVGFVCWLLSGYPLASLPLYYGGVSLAVAFHTVRCCHDDQVSPGVAHCYKPKSNKLEDVLLGVKTSLLAVVEKLRNDPRKVLRQWFVFW